MSTQIYRADWHDYRSRCIYMITISKRKEIPDFCSISCNPNISLTKSRNVTVSLSPTGLAIRRKIYDLPLLEPAVKLLQYSIMPDHLHILLFVQSRIAEHIGKTIARFKVSVNKELSLPSVFNDGFNDQILKKSRSLDSVFQYVRENPWRLAVRQKFPNYFHRRRIFEIEGKQYQAYGNHFLLHNPFKEQVIVHRNNTDEENSRLRDLWAYTAANGGVLVSPFISKAEKLIRAEAEASGGNIILITHIPFPEKYKPARHDFDLCAEGRLLIIAPVDNPQTYSLSRSTCLLMNTVAEIISRNNSAG